MTATENHVPSPADSPDLTADELLDYIAERGGRIFRLPEVAVFCLTQDADLANWLLWMGGKTFTPAHMPMESPDRGPNRAYRRARGGEWEWDIYIHIIPVHGERTIHEAAKAFRHGRRVEHYDEP